MTNTGWGLMDMIVVMELFFITTKLTVTHQTDRIELKLKWST